MRNYKSLLVLILAISLTFNLYAQENQHKYTYSIGGSLFKGFIYRHTYKIAHLINDHPTGFEIYAYKNTYGNREWQGLYNYPDIGLSLIYVNYHNEVLGKSFASLIYNDFYLSSHSKSNHVKLRIGGGLAYHSEHFDEVDNPKNNIISTDLTFALQMRLEYGFSIEKWKINPALTLTHFSNAAVKVPNMGMNVISLNLGISRKIGNYNLDYVEPPEPYEWDKKIHFNFTLSSGITSSIIEREKKFMSLNFSAYVDKRISRRSIINTGIDLFMNYAIREKISYDLNIDGELPDFKRIGIVAGHEFFMGRTAILMQFGYYIYKPYYVDIAIYQRYGLKYHINDNMFASLYLKSHNANAEMAELGLGLRL